jgi:hypothetical protein
MVLSCAFDIVGLNYTANYNFVYQCVCVATIQAECIADFGCGADLKLGEYTCNDIEVVVEVWSLFPMLMFVLYTGYISM